jgi:hypothetical protein
MKRRMFNLLAVVSLVFCLSTVAMLARSCWIADTWDLIRVDRRPSGDWCMQTSALITCIRGGIGVVFEDAADLPRVENSTVIDSPIRRWIWSHDRQVAKAYPFWNSAHQKGYWDCIGFGWHAPASGSAAFAIPLYAVGILTGIAPVCLLCTNPRRRRRREGRCVNCGYDLRATPDRCTECEAVPANAAPELK